MAFPFRLGAIAIFVTALLHLSAATSNSSGCTKNEFWYNESKCCLPIGGPKTPPLPPSQDDDCPPTSHYWSKERACCVPRHPSPPNSPIPQCRNGWTWVPSLRKCTRNPSKPTKPPAMPSPKPVVHTKGFGHQNKRHGTVGYTSRKRSRARSDALCPHGLEACPIGGLESDDYECIDAYFHSFYLIALFVSVSAMFILARPFLFAVLASFLVSWFGLPLSPLNAMASPLPGMESSGLYASKSRLRPRSPSIVPKSSVPETRDTVGLLAGVLDLLSLQGYLVDLVALTRGLLPALTGSDPAGCIPLLQETIALLKQVECLLEPYATQKGLANYNRNSSTQTLLKNLVNYLKQLVSDTYRSVCDFPEDVCALIYEIKCLVDEILNMTENLTDGLLNTLSL
ncbi:hypothetical protein ONZ45_g891 [Pleurotus djamor]|nr:hypothetical protein ONZ45_g891 [Pleurotus djamor]